MKYIIFTLIALTSFNASACPDVTENPNYLKSVLKLYDKNKDKHIDYNEHKAELIGMSEQQMQEQWKKFSRGKKKLTPKQYAKALFDC